MTNHSRSTIRLLLGASFLGLWLSAATFSSGLLPICDGDGAKELDLLNTLAQQRELRTGGGELLFSVGGALLQVVSELDLFPTSSSWVAVAKDCKLDLKELLFKNLITRTIL